MMAKEEKKAKIVRLTDRVAVRATATNPAVKRGLMKAGEIYETHPAHVPYLEEKKLATLIEDKE
jgi:hypothetical protein